MEVTVDATGSAGPPRKTRGSTKGRSGAMRVYQKPVAALARMAAPYNPRRISDHDLKALRRSLRRFDCVEPIVVNQRTERIVGGHQRVKAAEAEGIATLPVVYVDLDERAEQQLNLALNRIHGEFVPEALSAILADLKSLGENLELTGFDEGELADLLGLVEGPKHGKTDPDDVPTKPEPRTQRGDLWLLGDHRLFCGDATQANDVQMVMGGERFAILVTDPPYGVSYADKNAFLNHLDKGNRVQKEIAGDHEAPEAMAEFWRTAFSSARPFAKEGASYYVTGPQGGDLLLLLLTALRDAGFPLKHMLIWAKNNHVLGRSDYHYKHEPILFGWVKGSHCFHGPAGEVSLWTVDRPAKSDLHPTMKPVWLFARAIRNSSRTGDVVLDPFLGSGTSLIAAEQMGRRCFGLEIDPAYGDVIVARWEKFTGRKAERIQGGAR